MQGEENKCLLEVGSLPFFFSTSAHVSCPTLPPSPIPPFLLAHSSEKSDLRPRSSVTRKTKLSQRRTRASGEGANFRKASKKDIGAVGPKPRTNSEPIMKSCYRQGVSHAKERRLGRRAMAAMSAFVGPGEERRRKCHQQKK